MGLCCKIWLSVLPGVWIPRALYACICYVNNLMLCETFLDPRMSDLAGTGLRPRLRHADAVAIASNIVCMVRKSKKNGCNASDWNLFDYKILAPMLWDALDHQDFTRFPLQTHMTSLQVLVNPFALIILLHLTALKGLTFCRKSQV